MSNYIYFATLNYVTWNANDLEEYALHSIQNIRATTGEGDSGEAEAGGFVFVVISPVATRLKGTGLAFSLVDDFTICDEGDVTGLASELGAGKVRVEERIQLLR